MPLQARVFAAAFLVWAFLAPALEAQVVSGRAVLAGTEEPLGDVAVRLFFPDGRLAAYTVTDSAGGFVMTVPRLGPFSLSAERIGLAAVTTTEFQVGLSEEVEVVLRMAVEAVPLEPLVVEARSAIELGLLTGYYERMERQQRLGSGHFLSRDQIEERQALDVADLLRDIPRVHVVRRGSRSGLLPSIVFLGTGGECSPAVFIDGMHQNRGGAAGTAAVVDETVRPYDLEGVEVYRGLTEMPGEFYDDQHCGVILLWTRRDADGGRPFSLNRIVVALGAFLAVVFLLAR
jgi:hypothetical protein